MKRGMVVALVIVVGATFALLARSGSHSPAEAGLTKVIPIDAAGRETFAPAPPDAKPVMSADEAIATFERTDPDFILPKDATVSLGLYTAAVGDGTFRFDHALAYGLNYELCLPLQHEVPDSVEAPCDFWLFIDANTGEMLEGEEATAGISAG
jgi:hypothetical protein